MLKIYIFKKLSNNRKIADTNSRKDILTEIDLHFIPFWHKKKKILYENTSPEIDGDFLQVFGTLKWSEISGWKYFIVNIYILSVMYFKNIYCS